MSKERSTLEKKLDRVFSEFIRLRDKLSCQRCGRLYEKLCPGIQCSHFWGRRHRSTRWSELNCVALCGGCHMHLTANPATHREWYKARIGENDYNKLELMHSKSPHFTPHDLRLMLEFYRSRTLELITYRHTRRLSA